MDWGTISTRYYLFIVNTFVQCAALAFWIQLVHCHYNKGTCEMKISLQSIVLTEIVYNKIAFVLEKIGSLEWVFFLLLRECKVFTCSLFGRMKDNMKTKHLGHSYHAYVFAMQRLTPKLVYIASS